MKLVRPVTLSETEGTLTRASAGTYLGLDGVVATAAVDVPRWASGALLVEPAATNLLTYSEDLRNNAEAGPGRPWSQYDDTGDAVAVLPVSTTTPTGAAASVSKITANTTGAVQRQVQQYVTGLADGAVVTCAVHLRAAEVSLASLTLSTKTPAYPAVTFDLVAGSVVAVAGSVLASGIVALAGDWYRCWLAVDIGAGASTPSAVIGLRSATNTNYAGAIGDGLFAWGAQFEVAASPTSYIPTTTAAATRAADVLTGAAPCLLASNIPEPDAGDPALWLIGTTYALGDRARLAATHRIYQSLQAANTGNDPSLTASAAWWVEVSGTNRWALFDTSVSSASACASPLQVAFKPGIVDALVFIGLVGNTVDIRATDGPGGPLIYSRTIDLQVPVVNDWYSYFFEPFRQVALIVLADFPPYLNAIVSVTVSGDSAVAAGMCIPGRTYTIGGTQYGITAGIRDYSRKVVDEATGAISIQQRKFAKTLRCNIRADSALFNEITEKLESLRATPCMWVGDDTGSQAPLSVFGFYRDFRLAVDLPTGGIYQLEIEGMV